MDEDGLRGAGKVLLDALKENGGCGVIRDDRPAHLPTPVYRQVRAGHLRDEHVEILIEDLPATA
jgi:hypothetical protein